MKKQSLKVVTGLVRFGNTHVYEPQSSSDSDAPIYSVSIIIKKTDRKVLSPIKEAIEQLKIINPKIFINGSKKFVVQNILQDGDKIRGELAYKNTYIIYASSRNRPGVVDEEINPIIDPDEFYSGCYGRISFTLYPEIVNDENISIACELNNIQKLQEGIRL